MRGSGESPSGMQRNLRYLLDTSTSVQWRDWLAVLAPALVEEIGEGRAWNLLRRTGSAVALRRPLPPCATLSALEAAVVEELHRLNWGWARFNARDSGIDITHGAYPFAPAAEDPAGGWFAAVLEGLYTEWLYSLSANVDLAAVTTTRPESVGDVILLRYGRHGEPRLPL